METYTINLIYNVADKTVTGQRAKGPIQLGDTLVFQSSLGPVHVKLDPPDMFSAVEYQTGDHPVEVKKRSKFQYWCGVTIDGQIVGYPLNEWYGSHDDTDA